MNVLYEHIRDVARDPLLYTTGRVPDTIDGRFVMLVVHLALVVRRLKDGGAEARTFSQALFERFIDDMDQGLREAGVGDISVPKRLKKMTRVWYGHLRAMDDEWQPAHERGALLPLLPDFLRRNLFGPDDTPPDLAPLARYVHRRWLDLAAAEGDAIVKRAEGGVGTVAALVPAPERRMFEEASP